MIKRLFAIACIGAAVSLALPTLSFGQVTRSSWDGVYSATQADKGKALFENYCAKCHGGTLDGNDEIPALKGDHFMADWEGQPLVDLITRIHTTMPMDSPGALDTQSATSVVAYLLQQNGMPAGNADLDDGSARQLRIDPQKPGQ